MTDAPDRPVPPVEPLPEPAASADDGGKAKARSPEQTARAQRLAAALRDNLRRRKAPGRASAGPAGRAGN